MKPFVVSRDTGLSTAAAWARVTDWPAHARWVPLTAIEVTTPLPNGVGTVFNARTEAGGIGFDDPMEIVEWQPPVDGGAGRCRLEKRGTVMIGWAELAVTPTAGGSRSTWTEAAKPAWLPAVTDGVCAFVGRLVFGRVLRGLLES